MSRNTPEVPESEKQLDELKWEVAEELNLDDDIQEKGFANMTTREVGQIGGNMVKKMINFAEKEMAEQGSNIIDQSDGKISQRREGPQVRPVNLYTS